MIEAGKIYDFKGEFFELTGITMYQFRNRKDDLLEWLKEFYEYELYDGRPIRIYIKRVIGLPKEKVYIDTDKSEIYINGNKLTDEVYAWEELTRKDVDYNDIVLGEDEYYCLGDNRNDSTDSRAIGPIKGGDFVGKAIFKVHPITSLGFIDSEFNKDIRAGKREAYEFTD